MAQKELSILVKLRDEASAQLRMINKEIRNHQREWNSMFGAIAVEARRLGTVLSGMGVSIMAPLTLSVKSSLDEIREAVKKAREETEVSYAPGVTIKKTINNSGYSDAEIAQMEEMINQWDSFMRTIEMVGIEIGNTLLPVLMELFYAIEPVINSVTAWIRENPELSRQLAIIAATVGTLLTFMGTLGLMIGGLSMGMTALAGPIGLAVLAFVALGAAIALIVMNAETIGRAFQAAAAAVVNWLSSMVENFINSVISMLNILPNLINSVVGAFGSDYRMNIIPNVSLPRLATGGIVSSPTIALIGEAGPEAVVPLNNGSYGMISIGAININGANKAGPELAREIYSELLKIKNRNYSLGL